MYVYANEQIEFYYDECRMANHFSYCLKDPVSDELFVQSVEIDAYEERVQAFLPGVGADTGVVDEYRRLAELHEQAASYGNTTNIWSEEFRASFRPRYEEVKSDVILSARLVEKCTLDSYRPECTYQAIKDIRETGIQWLRYNERRRNEKLLEEIDINWVVKEIYRAGFGNGRSATDISQSIYKKLCLDK